MSEENKGFSISDIIAEVTAEEKDVESPDTPTQEAQPKDDTPAPESPESEPSEPEAPTEEPPKEAAPTPEPDPKHQVEELSKTKQALEAEVQRLHAGFQQVLTEVDKYLKDPSLYRQARINAGLASPEETSTPDRLVPEPEVNIDAITDIPSLMKEVKRAVAMAVMNERKHHDQAIQDAVARAEMSFRNETNSALQPHYVEKWKSAISDLSKEYGPKFAEVETEIRTSLLRDPSFEDTRSAYTNKRISEREALERVFQTKYRDRWLDHEVDKRLSKASKAKASSTEPKPTRSTKKSSPKSKTNLGDTTVMDIIAETDAELG